MPHGYRELNTPVSAIRVRLAAVASLNAAAVKARSLAEAEEREMLRLVAELVELQVSRP